MSFLKQVLLRSKRGQALVELTLIFPMLLTLSLGAVEIANLIYTYQVIHHVTAQAANIGARLGSGTTVQEMMNKVVDAACPVLTQPGAANCPTPNDSKWRVIYTEMGPDTLSPDPQPYIVREQVVLGSGSVNDSKRVCASCGLSNDSCDPAAGSCKSPNLPNAGDIAAGQKLYAVEVFYDYTPITVLGNFVGATFADKLYERSIF